MMTDEAIRRMEAQVGSGEEGEYNCVSVKLKKKNVLLLMKRNEMA